MKDFLGFGSHFSKISRWINGIIIGDNTFVNMGQVLISNYTFFIKCELQQKYFWHHHKNQLFN